MLADVTVTCPPPVADEEPAITVTINCVCATIVAVIPLRVTAVMSVPSPMAVAAVIVTAKPPTVGPRFGATVIIVTASEYSDYWNLKIQQSYRQR